MNEKVRFRLPIKWWMIILIFTLYVVGFILYHKLPDMVPNHWNMAGEVDGYMAKESFIIFFPSLILGLYLLMSLAPMIDPRSDNYKKFKGVFEGFRVLIVLVMIVLYLTSILFALGIPVPIGKVVMLSVGILWVFIGNYFGKVRFNYTFGIRTPWTLASEEVWNKTHRVSGPLWVAAGIIMMLSIFIPDKPAFIIDMTAIAIAGIYGFIYSYWLYNKLK
ncbi:MAG: hypothetical protein PWQ68_730 [Thermoanaerobacteraceae bacterium]|nr:hypothetical protein [Thermoanaerobacteraceae bacterium]